MKPTCLVPVRNKAGFIRHTIKSTLDQSYPCEIILSDHGSTDDSLSILKYFASGYRGHHTVRVLECPDTEAKGLAGLNVHLNWLMNQTDADLIMVVSDDLNHPNRVKRTVETYLEFNPSFIGTKMQFLTPEGESEGATAFDPKGSRFVTATEHLTHLVGGSCSTAWDRAFWDKVGGLYGHIVLDVYLPFLAWFDRGFYMIDEQLFAHVRHRDENNAGLGGRFRASEDDPRETLLLNELANYQIISTLYQMGKKAIELWKDQWDQDETTRGALFQDMVNRTRDWVDCRDLCNRFNLQPKLL